ncbi:MAG: division/cell wall cluster transcriptional repressor MraZ [Actinomycetota bacterium]
MFLGESRHSLDAKGRVILPVRFRVELDAGLTITKGLDGCLWVMSRDEWTELSRRIIQKTSIADPRRRNFARFIFSGASEDRPDKQGRILVPETLRDHAALEREVIVAGAGERIEIWNPDRWNEKRVAAEERLEEDIAGLEL